MSITKEELVQDNRFYIDDWNMDRLLERPVRRIKIKKIKLGNINRYLGLKIMGLQETDVFRYLEGNAESKELSDSLQGGCHDPGWDLGRLERGCTR